MATGDVPWPNRLLLREVGVPERRARPQAYGLATLAVFIATGTLLRIWAMYTVCP